MRPRLERYAALGIDALMPFLVVGTLSHDKVLQRIRLGGALTPGFKTPPAP